MDYKYTKHQVARGTRADHETNDKLLLLKKVSVMRATYQVRLLAFIASQKGKKLVIRMPKGAKIHSSLRDLRNATGNLIKIERV